MGLYKSTERCKQLEMEKLKQLGNLIKEKKRDKEERRRQWEHNEIGDEIIHRWTESLKETGQAYLKLTKGKKKQLDVLIQQQKQYKIRNKKWKVEYEEQLDILHQQQDQYKDKNE